MNSEVFAIVMIIWMGTSGMYVILTFARLHIEKQKANALERIATALEIQNEPDEPDSDLLDYK